MKRSDVVLGFICGMSRAGTTCLAKCLDQHPDVAVIGETLFWGRKFIAPDRDGLYSTAQQRVIIEDLKSRRLSATKASIPGSEGKEGHRAREAIVESAFIRNRTRQCPKQFSQKYVK